jgi:hypothetical protein
MFFPTSSPGQLFQQCLVAVVFGAASHLLFFIHGQCDREALRIIVRHGIVVYHGILGTASLAMQIARFGLILGSIRNLIISASYVAGLLASMMIYRLFVRPLRHSVGPLAARIATLCALDLGRAREERGELFENHRNFERVGESGVRMSCPS